MIGKTMRKMARSGTAICPVCGIKRPLCEHHINGRKIPNANASWNRVYICQNCHDDCHSGILKINAWVGTTTGKELLWERIK